MVTTKLLKRERELGNGRQNDQCEKYIPEPVTCGRDTCHSHPESQRGQFRVVIEPDNLDTELVNRDSDFAICF